MTNPIADPFVEGPDTDTQSRLVRMDATPEGAVTVTLDRADRNNALDAEVVAALREVFETLHAADGVRVVFVTGAGGVFSAGADLAWMAAGADLTEADHRDDAMTMATMLGHLHDLPALTVALVAGAAFGGGAGLVAACDMAIATREARFAFPEVKLGLVPGPVGPYVVAAVGARRARGLFASGREFGPDDAREIGLIDAVVDDAAALGAARERIAADIMACAPGAVAQAKRLVDAVAGRDIDHGLMQDTAHRLAKARAGAEGAEGVAAFLGRRKPDWAL